MTAPLLSASLLYQTLLKLRKISPTVHNITNYVVMNTTANMLLALGASPMMTHAQEELACLLSSSQALVLNMGTLDADWLSMAQQAQSLAQAKHIPIVFDPVGVGASQWRMQAAQAILSGSVTVIRGNASEIQALAEGKLTRASIDSLVDSASCLEKATDLAIKYQCTVVVSGPMDIVCSSKQRVFLHNGHPILTRITGMGCSATAMIAAFLSVISNPIVASCDALSILNLAAEKAYKISQGPGSFMANLLDALYHFTEADAENLRYEVQK